jgi:DNA ligase-1
VADFEQFAELCQRLASTSKKLEKRAWMAEYLRSLPVSEAGLAALYLTGSVLPQNENRELNAGGAIVSRALKEITGADDHAVHAAYLRHGDLGGAAYDLLSHRSTPAATLSLAAVAAAFEAIAAMRGPAPKQQAVRDLLVRATPLEAKYIVKLMVGDMRTGVKEAQVEEAMAAAYDRNLASVRHALMLLGNIAETLQLAALDRLGQARMRLFHPLGFMLASPVESVEEAMRRFVQEIRQETQAGDAIPEAPEAVLALAQMEDKYDGIRCQLHCGEPSQPGRVALFSRSREDMTAAFPELVEAFAGASEPLILDGEVLAWDPSAHRALPFSSLQPRIGRKRVTAAMRADAPVVFMAFDLLYRGNSLLLDQPLSLRRGALEQVVAREVIFSRVGGASARPNLFPEAQGASQQGGFARLVLAPATSLHSAEQLEAAYAEARARGNEGVMLKSSASLYQPGRRGLAWLKLKRELATLDVVVTAAEYGNGKRAGVLSDYTFAVLDGHTLRNVGKAYSGLTDIEIQKLSDYFHEHTLETHGGWRAVEPAIVLEVAFNNVMRSGRHASGFALRFPRIVRIRDDKTVEDIDTLARVEEIYNSQPDRPVEAEPPPAANP